MTAWFIAALASIIALSLARRLAETEEELRIETALRLQAEQRCEQLEKRRRRLVIALAIVAICAAVLSSRISREEDEYDRND